MTVILKKYIDLITSKSIKDINIQQAVRGYRQCRKKREAPWRDKGKKGAVINYISKLKRSLRESDLLKYVCKRRFIKFSH